MPTCLLDCFPNNLTSVPLRRTMSFYKLFLLIFAFLLLNKKIFTESINSCPNSRAKPHLFRGQRAEGWLKQAFRTLSKVYFALCAFISRVSGVAPSSLSLNFLILPVGVPGSTAAILRYLGTQK